MRILHVIATASGWGGLERCVTDLSNQQCATHTVAVAGAEAVLQRLNPAVQKRFLPMQYSRRDPRLLWAVRKAVREFKPDVIHAHAGKGAALIHSSRWLLPRIPRIATIHGTKKHLGFLRDFDRVITVSRRAGECLGGIPHTVIWNAIPPVERPSLPADRSTFPFLDRGKPVFASVGRRSRSPCAECRPGIGLPLERFETIVHPQASVSSLATLGRGVAVLPGATIAACAEIGNHVIILQGAIISHHCRIGDYSCIASGACLSGNVDAAPFTYIGANVSVRNGIKIGTRALVGLGSVVVKDVLENTVVAGNPAKYLRHTA